MPPVRTADSDETLAFTKRCGEEPIPGYKLLEPLGRGGFGEVWKCVAPGGLHKAIKFVTGGDEDAIGGNSGELLQQELAAFQQIKSIRHPFLLTLERVELVGNELVMVMELADRQLADRFNECRKAGLPGIPRDELIGYFLDAAEVLDLIGTEYGLQHLDVKPANLFLITGHVKVGDYGLVRRLDGANLESRTAGGLTPRYVAPEVLRGEVHTRSDQYSLALVYYELLTAHFPYKGKSLQQIMVQHISAVPDLSAVGEPDRSAISRALSKNPAERFESCMEFVMSVMGVSPGERRSLASRSRIGLIDSGPPPTPPGSRNVYMGPLLVTPKSGKNAAPTRSGSSPEEPTHPSSQAGTPALPKPGIPRGTSLPQSPPLPSALLTTPGPVATPQPATTPRPGSREFGPTSSGIRLCRIRSIVPVSRLLGQIGNELVRPPDQVVHSIFQAVSAGVPVPVEPGAIIRQSDGTRICRFLSTIDPRIAPVKLDLLWEEGGVTMDTRIEGLVIFQKPMPATGGLFSSFSNKKQKSGFEVVVKLPPPGLPIGEVMVLGRFFGEPPPPFIEANERNVIKLMEGVRLQLSNVGERRKYPRVPADLPVKLYGLHSDGGVDPPIDVRCKDISQGGIALLSPASAPARHAYLTFEGIPGAKGLAVLTKFIRKQNEGDELLIAGPFRLDLGADD